MARVAGIVLAAGAGTRFGGPKAPVIIEGERLVDRAVRVLHEAGCDPVFVVLGAWIGEVPGARVVVNEAWEEGMGSSLRVGLGALDASADAAVVTLVDLPGLTADAVRAIVEAEAPLAAATYGGVRGHPVKFPRSAWNDVIATAGGDAGAREYLRSREDLLLVEVGHLASGVDMDVPHGSEHEGDRR